MIFRRARHHHSDAELDARDRRRGGPEPDDRSPDSDVEDSRGPVAGGPAGRLRLADTVELPPGDRGPYDADRVDLEGADAAGWVDLGGLVVRPHPGMELRLQVDEATEAVIAPVLVAGESGMELRAFAAPRSGGLWDDLRRELAGEATQHGGLSDELAGPFGPELRVSVPVVVPGGATVTQTSRILGVDGPRWFLRATLLGEAGAGAEAAAGPLLDALRDVVVVRGRAAMAPREMIPLRLPDGGTQPSR